MLLVLIIYWQGYITSHGNEEMLNVSPSLDVICEGYIYIYIWDLKYQIIETNL